MDTVLAERIREQIGHERDRKAPPVSFAPLPEIPGGRYTRQDFFDLEIRHVFRRTWLLAGHVDEVPEPGTFKRFSRLLNTPVVIVRGRDGLVRAFYNTCRHRGAPVVHDERGRCNVLRCQFHSWAYDFDGRLIGIPDEHEFAGLDRSTRGLIPLRCETAHGLIFINQDPDALPLADWLGSVADEWGHTPIRDWTVDFRWSRVMNCNWKCVVDAFQEVYHIKTVHPRTVGLALDHTAAAVGLMPHGHSRLCVDRAPGLQGPSDDAGIYTSTSVSHTLWPNIIGPWGPTNVRYIIVWPRTPGQCEIEVMGLGPRWGDGPLPPERVAANRAFEAILEEDMVNLEPVQASLNSEAFSGMLLGYQERRIYWAHEAIDQAIGAERIPAGLAVPPRLAPLIEPEPGLDPS